MDIHKLLAVTLALVLVAGLGSPAFAQLTIDGFTSTAEPNRPQTDETDVIFDGGTSDSQTAFVIDDPPTVRFAEDFQLQAPTKLRDVHVDVLHVFDFDAEFDYVVYEDAGGLPGAIIQSGNGVNEHREDIAGGLPGADFRYWFDLDDPLFLLAGTTYWIELTVTNAPATFTIAWWSTGTTFGNNFAQSFDNGISWVPSGPGFDLNLVLTGGDDVVGGELLPIDSTSLLVAGAQTFSWMIPVILSGIGIGLFVVSRKSENSKLD